MGENFEWNKKPNDNFEKLEIASRIKLLEKMRSAFFEANDLRYELNELTEKNLGKVKSPEDIEKENELTEKLFEADEATRLLQIDGQSISTIVEMDTGEAIDKEIERLQGLL